MLSKQFLGGVVVSLLFSACLEAAPVDPLPGGIGNRAPKALISAGSDFPVGTTVTLRGDDSFDPDGDALSYHWSIEFSEAGETLEGTDSSFSFRLEEIGRFNVVLTVEDPSGKSDTITARVGSFVPIVELNAGPNRTVDIFTRVDLLGSIDPNGALETSFTWTMLSAPPHSTAQLANNDTLAPHFEVDRVGEYTFELRVDSPWSSFHAEVTIAAMASQFEPKVRYQDFAYSPTLAKFAGTGDVVFLGDQLQIIDPIDWSVETLPFPRPHGVAFSPDGARLALSYGLSSTPFSIAELDSSPLSVLQSVSAPASPSLRFAVGNQVVFMHSARRVTTFNLTTQALTTINDTFGDRLVAPTSAGDKFYMWSFSTPNFVGLLEVADTGPVFHGLHDLGTGGCTPLWPSPTEEFVISKCGQILRVSSDATLDLTEIAVLPATGITAAVHATAMGVIIVATADNGQYMLRAYNDVTFEEEWVRAAPAWYEAQTVHLTVDMIPRALFELPDGQTLLMMAQYSNGDNHRFFRFRP